MCVKIHNMQIVLSKPVSSAWNAIKGIQCRVDFENQEDSSEVILFVFLYSSDKLISPPPPIVMLSIMLYFERSPVFEEGFIDFNTA